MKRRYHAMLLQLERDRDARRTGSLDEHPEDEESEGGWGAWRAAAAARMHADSGPLASLQAILNSSRERLEENVTSLDVAKSALHGLNQRLDDFGDVAARTRARRVTNAAAEEAASSNRVIGALAIVCQAGLQESRAVFAPFLLHIGGC